MEWPSQNVPRGGILQPAKVKYNPATKDFLNLLMEESKMTTMQRKKINYFLRNEEPLPSLSSKSEISIDKNPKILIRPGSSKRRSLATIEKSGAYERERYVPFQPRVDREKEKLKLQNRMAFGQDIEPAFIKPKKPAPPKEQKSRFEEIIQEIQDREDFLKEMTELGEEKKYKLIIEQQIHALLREMENLKMEKEKVEE